MRYIAVIVATLSLHSFAFAEHLDRKLIAQTESYWPHKLYWTLDTDRQVGYFSDCLINTCRTLYPFRHEIPAEELPRILSDVQTRAYEIAGQTFLLNTFRPSLGFDAAASKFFLNGLATGFTAYSMLSIPRYFGPEAKSALRRSAPIASLVGALWGLAYYVHHAKAKEAPRLAERIETVKKLVNDDNELPLTLTEDAYKHLIRGIQYGVSAQ